MSEWELGGIFIGIFIGGYSLGRIHHFDDCYKEWCKGFDEAKKIFRSEKQS